MKEFEQPNFTVVTNEEREGEFLVKPLERGFGVTVGNAMRRVLLSSLPGLAVYCINVAGAPHEYTALEGVVEDLVQIVLNIKKIVLKDESTSFDDAEYELRLDVQAKGDDKDGKVVTAGDILCPGIVTVVNPDLVLCHLSNGGHISMKLRAKRGRGFVTAEENKSPSWPIGTIAVDSNFSPIEKVSITVDPYRVGHDSSYEQLTLKVETDGSMTASDAVALSAKILDEHFKLFENLNDAVKNANVMSVSKDVVDNKFQSMLLEDLDLSVRSYNCLKRNGIKTVQDLCNMTDQQLLCVRNLGKKSHKEIHDKLDAIGLSLQGDESKK